MKKTLMLGATAILALGLAACGDNGTATSSDDSEKVKEETKDKSEKAETVVKVETTETTGGAWVGYEGSEYVNIHSAAIYTNTGDVPVSIGESQINHKAKDGSILTTEKMVYAVPTVILPGESAYVGETSMVEGISADDYVESSFNFSFEETEEDSNVMEVSSVKGILGKEDYRVTGIVKNITDKQQDDIRLSAVLLDAEGKLLGVLNGSVDIGVAPGGEAGFELNYPDVPLNILDKIATVDVKSYGFEW